MRVSNLPQIGHTLYFLFASFLAARLEMTHFPTVPDWRIIFYAYQAAF